MSAFLKVRYPAMKKAISIPFPTFPSSSYPYIPPTLSLIPCTRVHDSSQMRPLRLWSICYRHLRVSGNVVYIRHRRNSIIVLPMLVGATFLNANLVSLLSVRYLKSTSALFWPRFRLLNSFIFTERTHKQVVDGIKLFSDSQCQFSLPLPPVSGLIKYRRRIVLVPKAGWHCVQYDTYDAYWSSSLSFL